MQIITLEPYQFDTYAKNHKYSNYYQTSAYGKTMAENGFNVHYLGIKDDNETLIGATLIVYKELFMNKKIAYAPRGILFDYTDINNVKELTQKLKQVLGKQGFVILRMDPYIPATIRDNKGNIINVNKEINKIMINIKSSSFKYKGQNKFFENELPRFETVCMLNKDSHKLFKNLSKRTRHKINRATGCGITIFNDKEKNIDRVYNLLKEKTNLSAKYIKSLLTNYKEKSNLYYALLNTDSFVIEAKKRYEKELEKNDILAKKIQSNNMNYNSINKKNSLNKKMESDKLINVYKNDLVLATELLKKNPKGLIIAAAITIEHNNASYLIIDGFDKNFSHLNANYLLKWYIIDEYNKKGFKYFNMNAVAGEFKRKNPYSNLNNMKLGFKPTTIEYIGEFDLILNSFNYSIYKSFSKDKNYKLKGVSK